MSELLPIEGSGSGRTNPRKLYRDLPGSGFEPVHSGPCALLVCPPGVETGCRFRWIVVRIRPYEGGFIPRSVAESHAFEGGSGGGAEFVWFVLLVRVIVGLGR
ncbi:hypothetical protein GCM10027575_83820 [Phytohabitans suffuscus]